MACRKFGLSFFELFLAQFKSLFSLFKILYACRFGGFLNLLVSLFKKGAHDVDLLFYLSLKSLSMSRHFELYLTVLLIEHCFDNFFAPLSYSVGDSYYFCVGSPLIHVLTHYLIVYSTEDAFSFLYHSHYLTRLKCFVSFQFYSVNKELLHQGLAVILV
jgi:hypothetical protein